MRPNRIIGYSLIELMITLALISACTLLFKVHDDRHTAYRTAQALQSLIEQGRLMAATHHQSVQIRPTATPEWRGEIGLYLGDAQPPIRTLTIPDNVQLRYRGFPQHNALTIYTDGLMRGNGTFDCQINDSKSVQLVVNHAGQAKIVRG